MGLDDGRVTSVPASEGTPAPGAAAQPVAVDRHRIVQIAAGAMQEDDRRQVGIVPGGNANQMHVGAVGGHEDAGRRVAPLDHDDADTRDRHQDENERDKRCDDGGKHVHGAGSGVSELVAAARAPRQAGSPARSSLRRMTASCADRMAG